MYVADERFRNNIDKHDEGTAKDVAGMCWGNCYDEILKRGILNALMKKAVKKNGFLMIQTNPSH